MYRFHFTKHHAPLTRKRTKMTPTVGMPLAYKRMTNCDVHCTPKRDIHKFMTTHFASVSRDKFMTMHFASVSRDDTVMI